MKNKFFYRRRVGADGKPEMYFFPTEMNNHGGEFPFTFFGLNSDGAPYGFILIAGKGKFGKWDIETPTLIRYNDLTSDEFFVSEDAAKKGVKITNTSKPENLIMLKHFAENPDFNEFFKL